MRNRVRVPIPSTTHPSSSTRYIVRDKNGVIVNDITYQQSGILATDSLQTTNDVVTPNFKQRIAAGEVINNPYDTEVLTWKYPGPTSYNRTAAAKDANSNSMTWVGQQAVDFGVCPQLLWLDDIPGKDSIYASVYSDAVQQAHANVDQSEMLALATVAESRKTVDFFVETGARLFRILKAAKKLDVKRIMNELSPKEFANRYMELRYAIRPLIYDVNGTISALEKLSRQYDRHTARGFASEQVKVTDTVPDVGVHWGVNADFSLEATFDYQVRAGVMSHVEVSELQIFGVDQLMTTAWELLPFSFIVDWFIDVGQAVAALSPKAGVTQLASWATETTKLSSTGRAGNFVGTLTSYGEQSVGWSIDYSRTYYRRGRAVDPLVSYWPNSNLNLDLYKISDLGIILKGLISGR